MLISRKVTEVSEISHVNRCYSLCFVTQLLTVHVTTKKVKRAKSFKVQSCFALLCYSTSH